MDWKDVHWSGRFLNSFFPHRFARESLALWQTSRTVKLEA